jgi:hypothetical protein
MQMFQVTVWCNHGATMGGLARPDSLHNQFGPREKRHKRRGMNLAGTRACLGRLASTLHTTAMGALSRLPLWCAARCLFGVGRDGRGPGEGR